MTYCLAMKVDSGLVFASDTRTNAGVDYVTAYGKPMLDRMLRTDTPLADAARLALVSLDATMRSNITVGPPFDLAIYERDRFALAHNDRIEVDSGFYERFRAAWQHGMEAAFRQLPAFDWE